MILDKIDDKRLLIALSSEDMDLLNITFKQLNLKNDHSKEIIKDLLVSAENEIGFSTDTNKFLIEAIPASNGCFILITLLYNNQNKSRKIYKIKSNIKPFVFLFKDCESLMQAIERIYSNHFVFNNSCIVEFKNSYYIVLYLTGSISSRLHAIISEYGEFVGKNNVIAARVFEKGNIIVESNAVEKLGKYLVN